MKTAIIVPCYNEERRVEDVLRRIIKLDINKVVIVVDDGSKDNTFLKVKENFPEVVLLRHKINLGKGAALKTGCEAALKLKAETIVFIDGDGQHSPDIVPALLEKLYKEKLDVVFGVRKIDKKTMPLLLYFGNKFLTKTVNLLVGVSLPDTQTGLKAFTAECYPKLYWQARDYSVETEMIAKVGKNKLKYGQVPINTTYKDAYKGTTIIDGVKILFNLLKQKFI